MLLVIEMHEINLKIIKIADYYIQKRYQKTLEEIAIDFSVDELMNLICVDYNVQKLINEAANYEQIYYYLEQIKFQGLKKVIPRIYDKDIMLSIHPEIVTIVSAAEIKMVFRAMRNNLHLYEKLYANKIYEITDTLNQKFKINITNSKVFHLFGMNFKEWQKQYRKEILAILPEIKNLLNENYIDICTNNDRRLYETIKLILSKEDQIINQILTNEQVAKAFPIPKMKAKNFAFERLGLINAPAGIVFYDKKKDQSGQKSMVSSDLFILRDFIMDYELRWIFNGYNSYGRPIKTAETLLLEKDTSNKFINQLISVSSNVRTINKSNIDFGILIIKDEDDEVGFGGSAILNTANKLIESFPNANLDHLNDLTK